MNLTRLAFKLLLGQRLPKHRGTLAVACRDQLTIRRDQYGVAYIDAQGEYDAWFGLGFCHGQDRPGQLETTLRLVRGTLASVAGPELLDVDRASRLIGVRHAASEQLPLYDEEVRGQLQAYCDGINAAFAAGDARGRRSHEHVLLRCQPTPWEPADVVAFGLMMCCLLPSNWDAELARLLVALHDGPDAVSALDPTYLPELPVTFPPGSYAGAAGDTFVVRDLERLRQFLGNAGGSNAWAIAPSRTATGRPLLANDPHLPASLPNFGYLARVKCSAFGVAGVSIVGAPAFISGHNGYAAWGSTAAQVDNTDLFLEELSPDGRSVREGDGFVPCSVRTEWIEVRGQKPERIEIVTTRRGPIVARADRPEHSIFHPLPAPAAGAASVGSDRRPSALSFSATWLRKAPTRALLVLPKVKSFTEFRQACAHATGCAYSLIYADPTTIGWVLAAEVPERRAGFGSVPMPGWDPDAGWHDEIKTSLELPYGANPDAGYLCTANNKPVSDSATTVFLGHDFLDGYRQERISTELGSRRDWDVARTQALQLDLLSLPWQKLREHILPLRTDEPRALRAIELLRDWDGRVSADSAAASVYELFVGEICQRVCRSKAPRSWPIAAGSGVMKLIPGTTFNARRFSFVVNLVREQPAGYFESWPAELCAALAAAVRHLEEQFGVDPAAWGWGAVRPLMLEHRFGGKSALASVYDVGPLPGYGDGTTVNQAGFEFWKPLRHSTVTAHLRTAIDVGDWDASRYVLLGGQSGNPLSAIYASLVPVWQSGAGVPIYWSDHKVQTEARHVLVLNPAGEQSKRHKHSGTAN